MKKIVLFLVLVSMVTGLAQAQTAQVRKLWEKKFPGAVLGHFYDEALGEPRITLDVEKAGRLVFDSIGNEKRLPAPTEIPTSVDSGWVTVVSSDGERIIGVKGAYRTLEADGEIGGGRDARIFICDRSRKLIARVPIPYLSLVRVSALRIYAVVQNDETGESQLIAFDRDGRELWRKREAVNYTVNIACADDGTLFSVEAHGTPSAKTWWARFYDKDGKVVNEVELNGETECWYKKAVISQDGKEAVYLWHASNRDKLYFIHRDVPGVIAKLSKTHSEEFPIWRISMSPNGKYLLADVANSHLPDSQYESRIVLYNMQGEELWSYPIKGITKPKFGGNRYLLIPADYGPVFKLFKIED